MTTVSPLSALSTSLLNCVFASASFTVIIIAAPEYDQKTGHI